MTRQGLQVRRSSEDLLTILGFSHPPDQYVPTFLTGWLDQTLRDALLSTPGIGDVRIFGSSELSLIASGWIRNASNRPTSPLAMSAEPWLNKTFWLPLAASGLPQFQRAKC